MIRLHSRKPSSKCVHLVLIVVILLLSSASAHLSVAQPSWDLPIIGGGRSTLSDLRGSIVVAAFGATWCPPCKAELPVLQALAEEYADKNVKALWITVDGREVTDQAIAEYARRLGVRFPVLRDLAGTAFGQFKQSSLPLLVVIDRQGRVVGQPYVGFSDPQSFSQRVIQLINMANASGG